MNNFKKILGKKSVTFILVLSFVFSTFYLPIFTPTPRAQAIFGVGDIVIDIKALARQIVDGIGMALAQKLIDDIVADTVKWANDGFEGNPAYATNPKRFFTNVADEAAGDFISNELGLGFLCSPFQAQIQFSLLQQYVREERFQCTLTDIGNFFDDFSDGGLDTWFSVTQNSANNPYGAYLEAQLALNSRVAKALNIEDKQLSWNSGFLSWSECLPGEADPDTGECPPGKRGPVQTPGSTIKSQLDEVLPTGLDKLITANHIDQLVGALISGMLKRFVFSEEGLFSNDGPSGTSVNYFNQANPVPTASVDECAVLQQITGVFDPNCVPGSGTGWTGTGGTGTGGCPTSLGYVYDPATGYCVPTGTDGGTVGTVPNSYGCVGSGCTPCTGTSCGVGETEFGDPAINGVYAGTCRINIVASFYSSVRMTEAQCTQVNQRIYDGITCSPSPSTGLPYCVGGTYTNAIKAIIYVCGGDGGGKNEDDSASHYICGFP